MELAGAEATISVRNEGPMIPPSDRERIFDQFYRVNPTGQGPPGSGLGLSIVRRIVKAHEGRVWVESVAGNTIFSLALPLAPAETAAAGRSPASDLDDIAAL